LVDLARQGRITLAIPAFAVAEARLVWDRRASERRTLQEQLQRHIRELSRSEPFHSVGESSRELVSALVASGEETRERLENVIVELASVGTVLPLNSEALADAQKDESELGFRPSDAIIYASVVQHARTDTASTKVFLNRNSKDFASPSVYDELGGLNCKVIVSFEDGVRYVLSKLSAGS
jgi:predicted nucleic acid-binding protein